jgi:uncharacterized protein YdeI (BOF family)
MKKRNLIVIAMVIFLISCNDGLSSSGGMSSSGSNNRIDRSKRGGIDGAKYTDLTVQENNAAKFTKLDILADLNGKYLQENGNGFVIFDRQEGTVTISSDNAFFNGQKGLNMYARYVFGVDAASDNCLYIRPDKNKKGQLIVGNEAYADHSLPDLPLCLPLYGFSRNRIEVSPIMNGYIAMPSGTYWLEKK